MVWQTDWSPKMKCPSQPWAFHENTTLMEQTSALIYGLFVTMLLICYKRSFCSHKTNEHSKHCEKANHFKLTWPYISSYLPSLISKQHIQQVNFSIKVSGWSESLNTFIVIHWRALFATIGMEKRL
jgi:hypothetical protein